MPDGVSWLCEVMKMLIIRSWSTFDGWSSSLYLGITSFYWRIIPRISRHIIFMTRHRPKMLRVRWPTRPETSLEALHSSRRSLRAALKRIRQAEEQLDHRPLLVVLQDRPVAVSRSCYDGDRGPFCPGGRDTHANAYGRWNRECGSFFRFNHLERPTLSQWD